jgi:arylsulfatase A-like enzyme
MLGAALARLDRAGFLDHTVVVVVSDHGEDLLDHGYMNHRTGLYDSTTRVPLVAWGPGFAAGKRERSLVDGRDVAATLLDVAGVAAPAGMSGRSLRSPDPALDAVFAEGVMDQVSVRTATHRLVYSRAPLDEPGYAEELAAQDPASSRFALFDLRVDPGELRDVRLDDPATTAALRDRLVAWRRGLVVATSPPADVSPEAAASLREHGYWDDPQAGDDATSRLVDGSCRARLQFLASP